MTLYSAVFDILTDMASAELLDFLSSNNYYDWTDDIESMAEEEFADIIKKRYQIDDKKGDEKDDITQ